MHEALYFIMHKAFYFIIMDLKVDSSMIQDNLSSSNSRETSCFGSIYSTGNSATNADLATWHSHVSIVEDALLHVLDVSNSALDLVDNILQGLLLRRVGRDSCSQHRDGRHQRDHSLCPLTCPC